MTVRILCGDALEALEDLPDAMVQTCVTSPPYWGLRDYGVDGQLGQEKTPEEYVAKLVSIFREVRRVLRPDGTLWLNLGDCYTCRGPHSSRDPCNWADKMMYGAPGVDRERDLEQSIDDQEREAMEREMRRADVTRRDP